MRSVVERLRSFVGRVGWKGGFQAFRPPTDFEILDEIYRLHRDEFEGYLQDKIMVPIDIQSIANDLGVSQGSVFGRLYYHLDPKYGEPEADGRPRKAFFSPVVGNDSNCVNFPLLEAVLAGLAQERRRDRWAIWTAVFSLAVAVAALLVSVFH